MEPIKTVGEHSVKSSEPQRDGLESKLSVDAQERAAIKHDVDDSAVGSEQADALQCASKDPMPARTNSEDQVSTEAESNSDEASQIAKGEDVRVDLVAIV